MFCPEVAGGFPVPRPAAEIVGRDGFAVFDGKGQVLDVKDQDITACFIDGAERVLEAARRNGVKLAILKEGSPSCGSTYIYDGTFSSIRKAGQGVTAALLERNGIRVFSEEETEVAADYIAEIEGIEPKCT